MKEDPVATTEQIQQLGKILIDVLQGAVKEGVTEISIGDFMRTFAYEEEEAAEWDDVILVFIKDAETEPEGPDFHILH